MIEIAVAVILIALGVFVLIELLAPVVFFGVLAAGIGFLLYKMFWDNTAAKEQTCTRPPVQPVSRGTEPHRYRVRHRCSA